MAQTDGLGNTNGRAKQQDKPPMYSAVSRPKRPTIKAAIIHELREFGTNTTAHAIPRALQAERAPIRVLWTIIFILASIIFLIHLGLLLRQFRNYPISTSVSYKTAEFVFPDVTICNLMPFSLRRLEIKDPGLIQASELSDSVEHFEERLAELLSGTENDKYSMILKCTYNKDPCGPENFTSLVDPIFGRCFTFSPRERIMANAPEYGLNLMLYAENKHGHDLPEFQFRPHENWQASGIRLVIHERRTHPHPDIKGVNVQTGVDARFAVNMETLKLYHIYRNGRFRCDNDNRDVEYCPRSPQIPSRLFKEITEDCYTRSIQSYFYDNCGCFSPEHEVPVELCNSNILNASSLCEPEITCYRIYQDRLREEFNTVVEDCIPTCKQVSYTKQMSTSDWPSRIAEKRILNDIRETYNNLTENEIDNTLDELVSSNDSVVEEYGLIKNNFLRISVYPEALTGNEITEDLAYPLANFVSEVGGILGLWLGGSMLTFLEPLEFIANFILILRMMQRSKKQDQAMLDIEAGAQLQAAADNGDPFCPPSKKAHAKPDPFCPPNSKITVTDPFCMN